MDSKPDIELFNGLLKDRLALGRERYGHGVRVADDTTQYGTPKDSWIQMALEESLDGAIYTSASIIRNLDLDLNRNTNKEDDNDAIVELVKNYEKYWQDHPLFHALKNFIQGSVYLLEANEQSEVNEAGGRTEGTDGLRTSRAVESECNNGAE